MNGRQLHALMSGNFLGRLHTVSGDDDAGQSCSLISCIASLSIMLHYTLGMDQEDEECSFAVAEPDALVTDFPSLGALPLPVCECDIIERVLPRRCLQASSSSNAC